MARHGRANPYGQTREGLEALVKDAQHLVELAQEEAARIISDARAETTRRVEELVNQAEQLRKVAETELAEAKEETDRIRGEARSEADRLLAQARATHDQVVKSAKEVEEAGTDPSSVEVLKDARTKADQILRVARAEAEARSAEMIEQAGRRVENADAEARARLDDLKRDYREMQRKLREEEIAVKARIADLAYQAGPKPESPQNPVELTVAGPVKPPAAPISRVEAESETVELPQPDVEVRHRLPSGSERRPNSDAASAAQRSIRVRLAEETEDPEVLKALKAFRRRH